MLDGNGGASLAGLALRARVAEGDVVVKALLDGRDLL
jgi:hypothetical protein